MLDTVVQELAMDPAKRWIQVLHLFIISILYSFLLYTTIFFKKVETAFFLRWWREQNEESQQLVWQLVQQGQVIGLPSTPASPLLILVQQGLILPLIHDLIFIVNPAT